MDWWLGGSRVDRCRQRHRRGGDHWLGGLRGPKSHQYDPSTGPCSIEGLEGGREKSLMPSQSVIITLTIVEVMVVENK